ncbi:hypothetical protein BKM31_29860 [[Actinomadura] parvosata subsp. kistnae]|uniref:Uncharacterized protein n=1 Tax=[Actinomadura] parvosata subsp. kistnae TaxID=1909395 RepID=A0A1V0A4L4_9ACTN|nr:hypothetical protein BKM31_29860 [Nonomuraea sp. ATCC 55076]
MPSVLRPATASEATRRLYCAPGGFAVVVARGPGPGLLARLRGVARSGAETTETLVRAFLAAGAGVIVPAERRDADPAAVRAPAPSIAPRRCAQATASCSPRTNCRPTSTSPSRRTG